MTDTNKEALEMLDALHRAAIKTCYNGREVDHNEVEAFDDCEETIRKALTNAQGVDVGWREIDDNTPLDVRLMLIHKNYGNHRIGVFEQGKWCTGFEGCGWEFFNVEFNPQPTHWRYLPPPPHEEQSE